LRICGDEGFICLPHNFWETTSAVLSRPDRRPETVQAPFRSNGFEGEIEETVRCARVG